MALVFVSSNLHVSKCCDSDNYQPHFLRECVKVIYLQIFDIFQRSLSTGDIPNDWKSNTMCIIKKGKNKNHEMTDLSH